MPTSLETLEAALAALDARILVLSAAVKGGYSIDGQTVQDNSTTLLNCIKARKELADAINAAEGPWEVEDVVRT